MRLALITLAESGITTCSRIVDVFEESADLFLPQKFGETKIVAKFYTESLSELTTKISNKYDGIAYVMAMGIVIRVIANNIKDKYTDPAIVVIDDVGRYVISALSGHEGGANKLSLRIANILHTDAVITTGSESIKDVIIGIGCKRNTCAEDIKNAIKSSLSHVNLPLERVA